MSDRTAAEISASMEIQNELRLYEDESLTKPAEDVSLGRVSLGQTYTVTKYLHNHDEKWPFVNIELATDDPDVSADLPQFVAPNETVKIVFRFSPPLSRREPFHVEKLIKGDLWIG